MVFHVLAAIGGATAVAAGAMAAHGLKGAPQSQADSAKTAAHYQLVHSLALFALSTFPRMTRTGSLLVSGVVLFCAPVYHYALTGDKSFNKVAPFGGVCLMAGWLSMAFLRRWP
ncbi:unnamed protein product [Phaeothamnion confervicola]